MLSTLLAAEAEHEFNPWALVIGGGMLVALLILLFILLAFGKGREHT